MARLAQLARAATSRAAALIVCAVAFSVLAPEPAQAQSYPRMRVIDLAQHADRADVAPGDVFHVTIHVKIAQRRDRLDELILGSFENCEIISNETVRTSGPDGTDFVERLTVQALRPGEATISPAYIDALDPALGKPMRYSSNAVRVHVSGPTPLEGGLRTVADIAQRLLLAVAIVAGFAAAVFVLVTLLVRRRQRRREAPVATAIVAPPDPAPSGTAVERIARAADAYAAARSQGTLVELRAELFAASGTGRGATLVDALQTLGERDRPLRTVLFAAERAMFGPAGERGSAGDDLLAAAQAYCGRPASTPVSWTR